MNQYLIVCPLVFVAGLIDAIAGGGGLISLPAYLIAGVPAHLALGTNKLSACMGTAVSTFQFARRGFLPKGSLIFYIAASFIGSTIGANLSLLISERVLEGMMLFILPGTAFYVFRTKHLGGVDQSETGQVPGAFWIALGSALAVGMYDGLYGPGTGTFLLLLLTGAARFDLNAASGTAKALNLTSNIAALVTFALNGTVLYPLGLAAGACSIAGNYLGSRLILTKGQRLVRPVILLVLGILFIRVLSDWA